MHPKSVTPGELVEDGGSATLNRVTLFREGQVLRRFEKREDWLKTFFGGEKTSRKCSEDETARRLEQWFVMDKWQGLVKHSLLAQGGSEDDNSNKTRSSWPLPPNFQACEEMAGSIRADGRHH